jgi:hypothetical protein
MPGWVVSLFVGFAHGTIMASKLLVLMAFMAVDDGFAIGDIPRVFRRGEIATSHQSNECN